MTDVKISVSDGYAKVKLSGHAGYGRDHGLSEGHDIVCSAISVLGQTLVQCVMDMAEANKVILNLLKYEAGVIDLRALAKKDHIDELETTIKTIATGFHLLSIAHPDYVIGGCWIQQKESGMVYTWNSQDTRERPWKGEN